MSEPEKLMIDFENCDKYELWRAINYAVGWIYGLDVRYDNADQVEQVLIDRYDLPTISFSAQSTAGSRQEDQ